MTATTLKTSAETRTQSAPLAVPISFVLPDGMGLGGVTSWTVRMANVLAARGYPTNVLEHVNHRSPHQEPISEHARHFRYVGRSPLHRLRTREVTGYLPAYHQMIPGIVIPNFSPGAYAACAALARMRPAEFRILGFVHADENYYYDLLTFYEPIIHRFVAVSQEIAYHLGARLPHRRQDILVRPYGVEAPPQLERGYTSAKEPIRLVYAGRLVEQQKRISDLPKLVQALLHLNVDFHFRIVGDGDDNESLKHSINAIGPAATERVELTGRLPAHQMVNVWREADVCILVSAYEGTSIAMLEAMAMGCVPVVTRVSGTAAVMVHGHNGFLVEVGEVERMAEIIRSLAQKRESLASIGYNGWRTVVADYSFASYLDWFVGQCDEVWRLPDRVWPADRSHIPAPYYSPGPLGKLLRRIARRAFRILRRFSAVWITASNQ